MKSNNNVEELPPLKMCFGCCTIKVPEDLMEEKPHSCCGSVWSTSRGMLVLIFLAYLQMIVVCLVGYLFSVAFGVTIIGIVIAVPIFLGTMSYCVANLACITGLHVRRHKLLKLEKRKGQMASASPQTLTVPDSELVAVQPPIQPEKQTPLLDSGKPPADVNTLA